jgi:hypothetical protein
VLISNKVNIWREIEADGAGLIEADTLAGTLALLRRWSDLPEGERAVMRLRAHECFQRRFDIRRAARVLAERIDGLRRQEPFERRPLQERRRVVPS